MDDATSPAAGVDEICDDGPLLIVAIFPLAVRRYQRLSR
jgi:hypothetical protein